MKRNPSPYSRKGSKKTQQTPVNKVAPEPVAAQPRTLAKIDYPLRILSVFIAVVSLSITLVLSWDQLFLSREERLALQREVIRLELEERDRLEREKQQQDSLKQARLQIKKMEEEKRLQAQKAKQQRLAAAEKAEKAKQKKPRRRKDPVGKFFKDLFR